MVTVSDLPVQLSSGVQYGEQMIFTSRQLVSYVKDSTHKKLKTTTIDAKLTTLLGHKEREVLGDLVVGVLRACL